eukprot:scaffold73706_cov22-Tisochrysis_lutea.AAC.1
MVTSRYNSDTADTLQCHHDSLPLPLERPALLEAKTMAAAQIRAYTTVVHTSTQEPLDQTVNLLAMREGHLTTEEVAQAAFNGAPRLNKLTEGSVMLNKLTEGSVMLNKLTEGTVMLNKLTEGSVMYSDHRSSISSVSVYKGMQ